MAAVHVDEYARQLMPCAGPKEKANSLGLIVELRPTAADIAFIMRECDADANGLIDKSELLIALSLWAELADQKMATQSACCFS